MKKRIVSIVITLIMLLSMLTAFSLPASAATIYYTVSPVVLFGGNDEYNIVWETNINSIGFVMYTCNGYSHVVYDEENGVVRTDDKMHTVRIPQEHLDEAGEYTVVSREVLSRDGFNIKTGDSVTFESEFYGYRGQEEITFGFISDSHLNVYSSVNRKAMLEAITNVTENFMNGPDVIVMQGDITNELIAKQEFYDLFEMFRVASLSGKRPIVYAVGNHEKRGFYSKEIEKYLVYDTGEFYGQINYGPISAYVSDIGEDKEDESVSYSGPDGGVVDMERYYPEQLYYFENHPGFKEGAEYTFTLGHGHTYVGYNEYPANAHKFAAAFKQKGTDFHICGHTHKLAFSQSTTYLPYPLIEDGWYAGDRTSQRSVLVTFKDGIYDINAMDQYGATVWTEQIEAAANGAPAPTIQKTPPMVDENVEISQPETNTTAPTKAGISTSAIKGASTTELTTNPVVFDAGEYYSVVWQTTTGIKCAGYVDIEGIEKTYMDAHGGKLRTETTHSVRIPKSVLSGKTYTVKSRVVTNYNGYGTHSTSDPLKFGAYTAGVTSTFADVTNTEDDYTILAVAGKTHGATDARVLLRKYSEQPNLLVLMGDMTTDLNTESKFASILNYARIATGGKYPVLLLRGENETKGEFAPYLSRIIRPVTPELVLNRTYHNFKQGNLSVIGLDTATKSSDNYLGYYGYASFDKLRFEQYEWLGKSESFGDKYNIVFANATDLEDCVGINFAENFKKHNVHLAVGAGDSAAFTNGNTMYSTASVGDAYALVINCKNDVITVSSVAYEMTELGTINTADVTYVPTDAVKTYTVTYTDGVDGQTIFADQKTTSIAAGSKTPSFNGFPVRDGFVFDGWTPVISSIVTRDVTYTAKWVENKVNTYTVTYTDGIDGQEIFADQVTGNLEYGAKTPDFNGGTPTRDGYTFEGWTPAVSNTVTDNAVYSAMWKTNPQPQPQPQPSQPKLEDSSLKFKDIKNKWYKTAVDYMTTYGYMNGTDADRFGPDESLTRGMFVTILARVKGVKLSNKVTTRFNDVKSGKYYTGAVRWASDNGIVTGATTTEFEPESNITREQLCTIITRFADKFNMPIKTTQKEITFTDEGNISKYAKASVKRCQMAGIVTGEKQGSGYAFDPKGNATRAECAKIIYEFLTK